MFLMNSLEVIVSPYLHAAFWTEDKLWSQVTGDGPSLPRELDFILSFITHLQACNDDLCSRTFWEGRLLCMRWKRFAHMSSSVISPTTRFETHRSHGHRDQSDGSQPLSECAYSSQLISSLEQKRGMSLLLVHSHGQLRFGW